MSEPHAADPRPDHVADVILRGPSRRLRARVQWPLVAPASSPAAVVLLRREGAPGSAVDLVTAVAALVADSVVLSVSVASTAEAVATVEWVADHAAELGADPDRLVLVADGPAADLAVAVAEHARDAAWPLISQVVLVHPGGGGPADDAGTRSTTCEEARP
jgi:hypothetical protein